MTLVNLFFCVFFFTNNVMLFCIKDDTPSVSAKPSMGKTDEVSGSTDKKGKILSW